ncbi:MAG TPA: hypothetical protein VFU05_18295, partial [Cyclobacteriaceae bacterium]|nr:hypothetical protein [Cyclobacteriaceae bacterium]
ISLDRLRRESRGLSPVAKGLYLDLITQGNVILDIMVFGNEITELGGLADIEWGDNLAELKLKNFITAAPTGFFCESEHIVLENSCLGVINFDENKEEEKKRSKRKEEERHTNLKVIKEHIRPFIQEKNTQENGIVQEKKKKVINKNEKPCPEDFKERFEGYKKWFSEQEFENVSRIKRQLEPLQLKRLLDNYPLKTIITKLKKMENYPDAPKRWASVYLTLLNWLEDEPKIKRTK